EALMNDLGNSLKPKVRCVMQLKNVGAGMPDGGIFTARQFRRRTDDMPSQSENPERGVIEIKGTGDDAWVIADTQQVSKYWARYRQVLVTNYRDFVLIGQDVNGQPVKLETYRLADNEKDFWQKVRTPRKFAEEHEEQFTEYLKRVMLQQAAIASPQDLAWFLASYARDAKARIEKTDLSNLVQIREALEDALGVGFEGMKGDRFFKSTLIQTLFYGIFSAWVLWHRQSGQGHFRWREAVWYMHVPMIQALFSKVATPMNLGRLDLVEVLDWAGDTLNRVDRDAFFSKFEEGQAVQYFYEPFLQAFDPKLRKDLGVWYTPPEIVQYMVARVDTVLREELDIADGLADPNVYILDPCCGTGAYLVEVLRKIDETQKANGADALGGSDLKKAAMDRVFGFEILTAPFVVAHLQLGLLLQNLGVPLVDDQERVGVYLTNALTGWEPPDDVAKEKFRQLRISFPELHEERDAAEAVKQGKPILVVLGNPPYNAYAGISPAEEEGLVAPYKEGLIEEWGIKKFNLDDLYTRFFRLAERSIADHPPGQGVVCYISNYSWLRDKSFVVLRQNLLNSFDRFWIENMHGDRNITEYAPDGRTSETIFAIPGFSPGIKQGISISLWVKSGNEEATKQVRFRNDIHDARAAERKQTLLNSLQTVEFDQHYELAKPQRHNYFSFWPYDVASHYLEWPKPTEFCAIAPINGLMEKRGGALMDMEQDVLQERMSAYLNPHLSWEDYVALDYGLVEPKSGFKPKTVRRKALLEGTFNPSHLVRYALRPFDVRWGYYSSVSGVWNRSRPTLWKQCWSGNSFLMTRPAGVASPEGCPFFYTQLLGDNDFLRGHAYYFPLQLMNGARLQPKDQLNLLDMLGERPDVDQPFANLSPSVRQYLADLGLPNPDTDTETALLIWMHTLAIGYTPDYLNENADGVRQDWPRIPLPKAQELLIHSANLGKQIAALLDTETPVPSVTSGKLRDELKTIATITRVGGGQLNPDTDLALNANWGYAGAKGVTMPGKGKMTDRPYTPNETVGRASPTTSTTSTDGGQCPPYQDLLGSETHDIYLNDIAYWQNIPTRVWDYTIGGYQVIKKWLSYREESLLDRPLNVEEVREVTNMARRIAAILLLEPQLNSNYEAVKDNIYDW
ncbi:MAG: type ISP restriction/modification enzyme, partial [Leptolyngbyaceae bacterium]|nr:type ISP restriction/modification enzyme [Leptolyngbyaceae bacterium]